MLPLIEMNELPSELIIESALNLDLPSIAALCQSSRQFNDVICNSDLSEVFWRLKFIQDYKFAPRWIKSWKILYQNYGETWCMGLNDTGQLGFVIPEVKVPVRLTSFKFTQVSAGFAHTLAIDVQGNAWSWGNNRQGELGLGDFTSRDYPSQIGWGERSETQIPESFFSSSFPSSHTGGKTVKHPFRVKHVASGENHSAFIDLEDNVWTCGDNFFGQLGHGEIHEPQYWGEDEFDYEDNPEYGSLIPVKIPNLKAKVISCGDSHTVAIDFEGEVWGWGNNEAGQLGLLNSEEIRTPTRLGMKAKQVVAGYVLTALISPDDKLWIWGANPEGQLGLGDTQSREIPTLVPNLLVKQVALGVHHTLALDLKGSVWGWGWNEHGELGLGEEERSLIPVRIPVPKAKSVTAGRFHSIIIDLEDNIWVSGFNEHGGLGLGDTKERRTFTLLPQIKGIQATAGYAYSIIIGTRIEN
jgi:alpha-tubulin suppressor-like RCC1 family protein